MAPVVYLLIAAGSLVALALAIIVGAHSPKNAGESEVRAVIKAVFAMVLALGFFAVATSSLVADEIARRGYVLQPATTQTPTSSQPGG